MARDTLEGLGGSQVVRMATPPVVLRVARPRLELVAHKGTVGVLRVLREANNVGSAVTIDDGLQVSSNVNPAIWAGWWARREGTPHLFQVPLHIEKMGQALSNLAFRHTRRLIINVPIRHGKSFLGCREFVVWYLARFPEHRVLIVTFNADKAEEWGGACRELFERRVGPVAQDTRAKRQWHISGHAGGLTAVGVNGTITGRGYHLIVMDDLYKNQAEALSLTTREKVWEYWRGTIRGRLEPGGVVLLEMARYHEDDICGKIEATADEGQWTKIVLPGIAEDGDPLGRAAGEPLWPERYTRKDLDEMKMEADMGPVWFEALVQQRPVFTSAQDAVLSKAEVAACKEYDLSLFPNGPIDGHVYCAGGDWAKTIDNTSLTIWDTTSFPYLLVFQREWHKGEGDPADKAEGDTDTQYYTRTALAVAGWLQYWNVREFEHDLTGLGVGVDEMIRSALKGLGHACHVKGKIFTIGEKIRLAQGLAALAWQGKLRIPHTYERMIRQMEKLQHVNARGERYAGAVGEMDDNFYSGALGVDCAVPGKAEETQFPGPTLQDRAARHQREVLGGKRKKTAGFPG